MKYHSFMAVLTTAVSDEELEVQVCEEGGMVQRTIWGAVRLIAVRIPAPVAGRGLEHGVKRGVCCEALVDQNSG